MCKVYLRTGLQAPQEIGELGVGQIIGASTHILGLAGEPYHVVCASARVEVLRMEINDIKTRLPLLLLEAIAALEKDRLARLQQRVQSLKAVELLNDAKSGIPVQRKPDKEKWLHTPFLCNKQSALLEDVVKYSQMHRLWCDWEPSGIERDHSANDSILRGRYDDDVAADCPKLVEDGRERAALALPWHDMVASGRSFRSRFVKRGHAASPRASSPWNRRHSNRHDGAAPARRDRPQTAPCIHARIQRWVKPHEDFVHHGTANDDMKYVDFISDPISKVWSVSDNLDYIRDYKWDTCDSTWTDSYQEVSPDSTMQRSYVSAAGTCQSTHLHDLHKIAESLSDQAHGGHEGESASHSDIQPTHSEVHRQLSSATGGAQNEYGQLSGSTLSHRPKISPESESQVVSPDDPAFPATESGSPPIWSRQVSSDSEHHAEQPVSDPPRITMQSKPDENVQFHNTLDVEWMSPMPFLPATSRSPSKVRESTGTALQIGLAQMNGVDTIKFPEANRHPRAAGPCRLPGALNSKHFKRGSPRPSPGGQRPLSTPLSTPRQKQLQHEKVRIQLQTDDAQMELTPPPPRAEKSGSRPASKRHSLAGQEPPASQASQEEASPQKQTWTFVQKYGQLGAQRSIQRSSERQDALVAKAKSKSKGAPPLPGADEDRAARSRRARMEQGARRLAGRDFTAG
mmetsp:Transcript_37683/g.65735  ORF Transcript_37683/g.65735 Transcript_37683/m.65735 type:complete len:685 (+) Transcript_37683:1-2055(+)